MPAVPKPKPELKLCFQNSYRITEDSFCYFIVSLILYVFHPEFHVIDEWPYKSDWLVHQ